MPPRRVEAVARVIASALGNPFFRFLVAGAINTVLTFTAFLVLNQYVNYAIAYTLSYLAGIILSYALATSYVFRTGIAAGTALRYPLVYLIQYLYGLIVLTLLVNFIGVARPAAMIVVILTSVPLTFFMTRYALRSVVAQPPDSVT